MSTALGSNGTQTRFRCTVCAYRFEETAKLVTLRLPLAALTLSCWLFMLISMGILPRF